MESKLEIDSFQEVAQFLKDARHYYGLSQEDVSTLTKTQRTWLSKVERGLVDNITLNNLLRLLDGLNAKIVITYTHT